MNTMADDTLALTVAEATMQDWLAAAALMKGAPMPLYVRPTSMVPEVWSAPVRRRAAARGPAAKAVPPVESGAVGGARTVYWVLLALAVGALALA